jgi:valyl-tRNA synthetase
MYDDGLIYQKDRVVNWDPKGQTTISDEEVDHEEVQAIMYTFKYSKDFPIPIATTRPETKVGDVAVAVNPDDDRYKEYIGQTFELTFCEVPLSIKVVADKAVDPEFGTGAVGVTPAHSQIDYEIGARHHLPLIQVINEYAKMNEKSGPILEGLKTSDARIKVAEWLEQNDLIIEKESVVQNLSKSSRSGGTIEPLPKLQWWISVTKEFTIPHSNIKSIPSGSVTTLQKLMLAAIEEKQIDIIPDRYEKVYLHWVRNLRDWCISRQIWYGHQIPIWYKDGEIYSGVKEPSEEGWVQDEDTLDTWFSSGLWTFSTLGWPEETTDMKRFHPTNVLETGHDILPFWVMRMVLMSTYLLGEIPFDTVYLHGMVQNKEGKKMSKSSGDAIDPLDISEKFGADALRLSLIIGNGPGNDIKLSEEKIRAYRKFSNKIWNASRFVLESANTEYFGEDNIPTITDENKKELDDLNAIVVEVTKDIEEYRFYIAGEKLYHYFWHNFADVIIERNKEVINDEGSSDEEKASASYTLYKILTTSLKILHPFMPFITETIWQNIPSKDSDILMVAKWPLDN